MCREPGARGAVVVAAVDCTHSLLYNIARCNIQKAAIILLYTLCMLLTNITVYD